MHRVRYNRGCIVLMQLVPYIFTILFAGQYLEVIQCVSVDIIFLFKQAERFGHTQCHSGMYYFK